MTTFTTTAASAYDYASEIAGVIRDAGSTGDTWYRSNATDEYLTYFFNVTLPDGCTIDDAKINFYFPIGSADEPNHTIDAEDVANATAPVQGDANNSISGRTGTTATVNWLNTDLGAAGYFDTPDIKTIVQELVDSYDFSSGNHVLFRMYYAGSGGDAGIATQAYSGNPVATLTINYTASGGDDALVSTSILSGTPVISSPTIAQIHALTSTDIVTGAAIIEQATIAQIHALVSSDITTGNPAISSPVLATAGNTDALTATDILAGTPTISAPSIAQIHALTSVAIIASSPVISTPTITQNHVLTSMDILAGTPVISSPYIDATLVFNVTITESQRSVTIASNKRSVTIAANKRGVTIAKKES